MTNKTNETSSLLNPVYKINLLADDGQVDKEKGNDK